VSARVSVLIYNPSLITEEPAADLGPPARRPEVQGASWPSPPGRPTSSRSSPRCSHLRAGAALKWLEGIKANAGSHVYPDNETIADEVNRGAVAFGVVNQYYWYRMRAELGASNMHSKITYFAPHDPGYVLDVSGAAILKSSKHRPPRSEFLAFLVSKQGQEIIAHSISFEYPIASGVTTAQPETPFDPAPAELDHDPELGDGSTAIALLRQAGLL
jgi:iron(III) transport system substrate-binding protein